MFCGEAGERGSSIFSVGDGVPLGEGGVDPTSVVVGDEGADACCWARGTIETASGGSDVESLAEVEARATVFF